MKFNDPHAGIIPPMVTIELFGHAGPEGSSSHEHYGCIVYGYPPRTGLYHVDSWHQWGPVRCMCGPTRRELVKPDPTLPKWEHMHGQPQVMSPDPTLPDWTPRSPTRGTNR